MRWLIILLIFEIESKHDFDSINVFPNLDCLLILQNNMFTFDWCDVI